MLIKGKFYETPLYSLYFSEALRYFLLDGSKYYTEHIFLKGPQSELLANIYKAKGSIINFCISIFKFLDRRGKDKDSQKSSFWEWVS
jgi:hypothetical protein